MSEKQQTIVEEEHKSPVISEADINQSQDIEKEMSVDQFGNGLFVFRRDE